MSKAEKFIEDCTRTCSNLLYRDYIEGFSKTVFQPWLTPEQAREAVEIASEEIYKWLANHYRDYMYNPTGKKLEAFFGMDMINDLKQAMNDEEIK
jgi:hypothetical protein